MDVPSGHSTFVGGLAVAFLLSVVSISTVASVEVVVVQLPKIRGLIDCIFHALAFQ